MNISTTLTPKADSISSRFTACITALTLGLIILFGVGFAQGENDIIHNTAHDTRHTMAFACH